MYSVLRHARKSLFLLAILIAATSRAGDGGDGGDGGGASGGGGTDADQNRTPDPVQTGNGGAPVWNGNGQVMSTGTNSTTTGLTPIQTSAQSTGAAPSGQSAQLMTTSGVHVMAGIMELGQGHSSSAASYLRQAATAAERAQALGYGPSQHPLTVKELHTGEPGKLGDMFEKKTGAKREKALSYAESLRQGAKSSLASLIRSLPNGAFRKLAMQGLDAAGGILADGKDKPAAEAAAGKQSVPPPATSGAGAAVDLTATAKAEEKPKPSQDEVYRALAGDLGWSARPPMLGLGAKGASDGDRPELADLRSRIRNVEEEQLGSAAADSPDITIFRRVTRRYRALEKTLR